MDVWRGREWYKASTDENGTRKRSARDKIARGSVQHGEKLQEGTFGIRGNCITERLSREEMSQRIYGVRAHSARR